MPAPLVQRSARSPGLSSMIFCDSGTSPVVRVDAGQPLVHREDRLVDVVGVAEQRHLPAPQHLVGGRAEVAQQPGAHRVGAVDVVERARVRTAQVDDRDLVEVVRGVDGAAAVGALEADQVGLAARRWCTLPSMSSPPMLVLRSTNCAA